MNIKIKELLDIAKDYIANLEYKNDEGIATDADITVLNEAIGKLKEADLSIKPSGSAEVKSNQKDIKESIADLYEIALNDFSEGVVVGTDIKGVDFSKSIQFKEFRANILSMLTLGLKNGRITASEYDNIMDVFGITVGDEEINNILADDAPMPAEAPPEGKQWVKQQNKSTNLMEWVLIDKA
jgi:hypothetical protein